MNTKELYEKKFAKLNYAIANDDYSIAPFGTDYDECQIYIMAQQSLMQWVLEMWSE